MSKINIVRLFYYFVLIFSIDSVYAINIPVEKWQVKKVYKWELVKKDLSDVDDIVIESIVREFSEKPYYENYKELQYFGNYLREEDNTNLLFFYNIHVDGIQIVYELNTCGKIINRYTVSEWQ